jgi:hypothetical protein
MRQRQATVTTYLPWLPWLPWAVRHKWKQSYLCRAAQGGQGDCRMLLSLTVSLTNVANVNDPLEALLVLHFNSNDSLKKVFYFLFFQIKIFKDINRKL